MDKLFKFTQEDFGKLPVQVLHIDLRFDIFSDHTDAHAQLKLRALQSIRKLSLNAKDLDIRGVTSSVGPLTFTYRKEDALLDLDFSTEIPSNAEFTIATLTTCKPTKNLLEGLYFDETPKGAPPQMITQCQQWGFQRLIPCFDDMTAKCTYRTTITADVRYTHVLTNGDLVYRKEIGNGRVEVCYDNTKTPMSCYLFFLGVGTYAAFQKEFEYPDGKTFTLELLVPPDADTDRARKAVELLYHGVLWIHLFTGPDKYKNEERSRELWKLVQERDALKRAGKDCTAIRKKLKERSQDMTLGYRYTGKVYREIGMQNSDFGGMENVGNTTITTNRIMPFPDITDGAFEYLMQVKTHEFYHNLNGSEITGWSPFEIWLNEAVTVHVEGEHHAFVFGEEYSRLEQVQHILAPLGGTLGEDDSAASQPIEPDGFNDPNELITAITYVKAPEFVRMIQTLIGKENFVKGLDLYHRTFKHRNATRKQWVECMEKASGIPLQQMAETWLKEVKFPVVEAKTEYADGEYCINLTQQGNWEFPFSVALCDANGIAIAERIERMQGKRMTLTFPNVAKPAFASLARGYSFYGRLKYSPPREELLLRVDHDPDIVNRFIAFAKLMDAEKLRLLEDTAATVSEEIVQLYGRLLSDRALLEHAGAQFLLIFESVEDPKHSHRYRALYETKRKIQKTIATAHKEMLLKQYAHYAAETKRGDYLEQSVAEIKNRQCKNLCLALLSTLDTPEVHTLIKQQFTSAHVATDKIVAFRLYLNSTAHDRLHLLEHYAKVAQENLVRWETFLSSVGGSDAPDVLQLIARAASMPTFRIEQTNEQRALYGSFANNRKKSLEDAEGLRFLTETIIRLAPINEYSTVSILKVFGNADQMEERFHLPIAKALVKILGALDAEKTPSAANTAKRILVGLPKVRAAYEQKHGKIQL